MAELLEGTKVFAVPLFQRQYSWEREQWRALWKNLDEQYQFAADEKLTGAPSVNHFIGSFVLSPIADSDPPPKILVIDGQQRLITISVLLAVLRDLRWEESEDRDDRRWLEDDFTKLYFTNSVLKPNMETRYRVLPTQKDREDFRETVGNTPARPAGRVGEAYRFFQGEIRGGDIEGRPYDLEQLTDVLLRRLTLIDVRTERGDNVHRVFQTLNSSGVRLKQIDLLRNHFFMLLPSRGEQLYLEVWRDMELRLGESAMDSYFWASLVPYDSRVSRKTVFSTMQSRLERSGVDQDELEVETVLRELNANSIQYLSLIDPSEEMRTAIRVRLEALKAWGTDTYYPLGLRLLCASEQGRIDDRDLEKCLLRIESFLVRRMLVGIPTNNLNRVFSALTAAMPEGNILNWLQAGLTSTGKPWPDDGTVVASVLSRPFFFSGQPGQRRYVAQSIENWLHALAGDNLDRNELIYSLDRALPPDVTGKWPVLPQERVSSTTGQAVTPEAVVTARERVAHTFGNVTLLPKGLSLGGASFEEIQNSVDLNAILFNHSITWAPTWDPARVQERSQYMAQLILQIWPGPQDGGANHAELAPISERAVLLLPEGGYTHVSDLAELWAVDEVDVIAAMQSWPADVKERVKNAPHGKDAVISRDLNRRFTAPMLFALLETEESDTLEQDDE